MEVEGVGYGSRLRRDGQGLGITDVDWHAADLVVLQDAAQVADSKEGDLRAGFLRFSDQDRLVTEQDFILIANANQLLKRVASRDYLITHSLGVSALRSLAISVVIIEFLKT